MVKRMCVIEARFVYWARHRDSAVAVDGGIGKKRMMMLPSSFSYYKDLLVSDDDDNSLDFAHRIVV